MIVSSGREEAYSLLLHAVLCREDMGAGYGNCAVHENVVLFQQLHVNADLPGGAVFHRDNSVIGASVFNCLEHLRKACAEVHAAVREQLLRRRVAVCAFDPLHCDVGGMLYLRAVGNAHSGGYRVVLAALRYIHDVGEQELCGAFQLLRGAVPHRTDYRLFALALEHHHVVRRLVLSDLAGQPHSLLEQLKELVVYRVYILSDLA